MKSCSVCKKEMPLFSFSRSKKSTSGYASQCKTCDKKRRTDWKLKNPEKVKESARKHRKKWMKKPSSIAYFKKWNQKNKSMVREYGLKRNYGISSAQYDEMIAAQDHRCKICGKHQSEEKTKFSVDHCHSTGKIRGILCRQCNTGLGNFGDSTDKLAKALSYLGSQ